MKTSYSELQRYEELLQSGIDLDPMVVEKARAACRGIEIIQAGSGVVYVETAGTFGIMLDVHLENISDDTIRIDSIRLKMPWFDGDFRWLKKRSAKSLRQWGGYVLSGCGPCGVDESVVLNHLLVRGFKLYPGDVIYGLLLGEGTASVPEEFSDRTKVPMELVVYSGRGKQYSGSMKLVVNRKAPSRAASASKVSSGALTTGGAPVRGSA